MRAIALLAALFCAGIAAAAEPDLIAWALGFAALAVIAWLVVRARSERRSILAP
jgi:hypothetical protein